MKKVHPLEMSNNSISNISTNEVLENSVLLICRFCKKTLENQTEDLELIFPCTCTDPIHKCCLEEEMKSVGKTKLRRIVPSRK
jgi:E3 ubiquitin-protein ligase DOA10